MRYARVLALTLTVAAMLGAPLLQPQAEAQRRGGDRGGSGTRGGVRTAPAPRAGRVAPAPRPDNRAVARPRSNVRVVVPRRGGVVIGGYYGPLYYSPFYPRYYDSFYGPWSPYGYYGGYPRYEYGQFYRQEASLRLQVSPRATEVFVDGYYAGTVDDFDGIFQRLRLESGAHELTLYLPGYRTVTQQILLQPGRTFSVKHEMVAQAPGEAPEPRPELTTGPTPELRVPGIDDEQAESDRSFGALAIRVQPADAEVLVDGERWEGPGSDEALVLQVAPGSHRIEVRKDGYRGYTTQVDVHAGQTAPINVSLPRQ